jgi:hypothetical protein
MAGCGKNLSQALEPAKAPGVSKHAVAGNGSSPAATRPPRWPRAYLASTDEKPGLAPSRALLAFGKAKPCAHMRRTERICADLSGSSWSGSGEARRGVRRDPEPPAGTVIRNTTLLTCPTHLTLPYNQGRKVDGYFFDICPQSRRAPAWEARMELWSRGTGFAILYCEGNAQGPIGRRK